MNIRSVLDLVVLVIVLGVIVTSSLSGDLNLTLMSAIAAMGYLRLLVDGLLD